MRWGLLQFSHSTDEKTKAEVTWAESTPREEAAGWVTWSAEKSQVLHSVGWWVGQPPLKRGKSTAFARPLACDEPDTLLCPSELAEEAFLRTGLQRGAGCLQLCEWTLRRPGAWSRTRLAELTLGVGRGRPARGSHPGVPHGEQGGCGPGDATGLLHAGLERAWQGRMKMISAVGRPPLFLGDYVTVC